MTSTNQSYDLGEYVDAHYSLLEHVLNRYVGPGIALEFGVGAGNSTRLIAQDLPVIGFDSFEGLPEDWREGYPKGMFVSEQPVIDNASFVVGLFEDTLKTWHAPIDRVALIHVDCDLYSSTRTMLNHLDEVILQDKPCIVFDEWHGFEGCENYEQRAWREFTAVTDVQWRVLGHGHQAWGIEIV